MKRRRLNLMLKAIDGLSLRFGKYASYLIILMIIISIVVGIFRVYLHTPLFVVKGQQESGEEESADPVSVYTDLLVTYLALGLAYTLRAGTHISFDMLSRHFSPRLKAFMHFATYPLVIFAFSLLLWKIMSLAPAIIQGARRESDVAAGEVRITLWAEVSWTMFFWFVGTLLLILECLAQWIRSLMIVITGRTASE